MEEKVGGRSGRERKVRRGNLITSGKKGGNKSTEGQLQKKIGSRITPKKGAGPFSPIKGGS